MMNAAVVYLDFLQKNLQQGKKRQVELREKLKREKDMCVNKEFITFFPISPKALSLSVCLCMKILCDRWYRNNEL